MKCAATKWADACGCVRNAARLRLYNARPGKVRHHWIVDRQRGTRFSLSNDMKLRISVLLVALVAILLHSAGKKEDPCKRGIDSFDCLRNSVLMIFFFLNLKSSKLIYLSILFGIVKKRDNSEEMDNHGILDLYLDLYLFNYAIFFFIVRRTNVPSFQSW